MIKINIKKNITNKKNSIIKSKKKYTPIVNGTMDLEKIVFKKHIWYKSKYWDTKKGKKPDNYKSTHQLHKIQTDDYLIVRRGRIRKQELYVATLMNKKNLLKWIKANNYLYECIAPETSRKVYFDIDGLDKRILKQAIDGIKSIFGKDTIMAISGSEGIDDKYSYHIVLPYYHFDNNQEQKESNFIDCLSTFTSEYSKKGELYDTHPYGKFKLMKSINQKKLKEKRVQKPMTYIDNPEYHIIQYKLNESKNATLLSNVFTKFIKSNSNKDINKVNKTRIRKLLKPYVLKKDKLSKGKHTLKWVSLEKRINKPLPLPETIHNYLYGKKGRIHKFKSSARDLLFSVPNKEGLYCLGRHFHYCVMGWTKGEGLDWKTFREWEATYEGSKKTYMNQNEWKKLDLDKVWSRYSLWRLLEIYYGKIPNFDNIIFKEEFFEEKDIDKIFDKKDLVSDKYIDAEKLLVIPNKYIGISSQMGSGKTEAVIRYIKKKGGSVLWVTNRITMARNLMGRVNREHKLCFKHYKDCGDTKLKGNAFKQSRIIDMRKQKRLICELESIHYVKDNKYDIIIMDEIQSLFNCFLKEDTHLKGVLYQVNYEGFRGVLLKANKVFLMDAFLHKSTNKYINCLENKDMYVVTKKNDKIEKIVNKTDRYYNWIWKIVNDLRDGKNLYIFYPYKTAKWSMYKECIEKFADKIAKFGGIKKEEVLVYYGSMNDSDKRKLEQVNEEWRDKRVIITNGAISVGVSFEEEHFDKIYMAFSEELGSPRDFIQASFRIRQTKEQVIEFYKFPHYSKFMAYVNKTMYIPKTIKRPIIEDDYPEFYIMRDLLLKEYESSNYEILKFYMNRTGYKLIENKDTIITEFEGEWRKKTANYEVKYNFIPIISNAEYYDIKKKIEFGKATKGEKDKAERWYNDSFYIEDTPEKIKEVTFNKIKIIETLRDTIFNKGIGSDILDIALKFKLDFDNNNHFTLNTNKLTKVEREDIKFYLNLPSRLDHTDYILKRKVLDFFFGRNIIKKDKNKKVVFNDCMKKILDNTQKYSRYYKKQKRLLEKKKFKEEALSWLDDEEDILKDDEIKNDISFININHNKIILTFD